MRVHGITDEFLKDKRRFHEVVDEFKAFIKDSELIIHNATFDVSFIENEFKLIKDKKWQKLDDHCKIFDTLTFARQKHPGQRNNLDALCKRYNINNEHREKHGALLDSEILAEVYLAMTGGQETLVLEEEQNTTLSQTDHIHDVSMPSVIKVTPLIIATGEELLAHQAFLKIIDKKSGGSVFTKESEPVEEVIG